MGGNKLMDKKLTVSQVHLAGSDGKSGLGRDGPSHCAHHRSVLITERFGLEVTLKAIYFQLPCRGQGH